MAELVYDNHGSRLITKIYKHNDHSFRMYFPHINGDFNKPELSIMLEDGTWKVIETNDSLNVEWKNLYFLCDNLNKNNLKKINDENSRVEKAFLDYINSVY